MTDESMSYLEALKEIKRLKEALEQQLCEDAVSRQAVHDVLKKHWLSGTVAHRVIDEIGLSINALPPVTPKEKTGWIPVSERLPESEGYGHYFLCCLENGIIRILGYSNILTTRCPKGFYYEKENGTTWRQDINPVIAWMPLPERYKDGE